MKPGDKVKIIDSKFDRLVGRVGTVVDVRTHYPRHIKVRVEDVPRKPSGKDVWYVVADEVKLVT